MPATSTCYSCDRKLTPLPPGELGDKEFAPISKEHIIPDCLGGQLSSNHILCRPCNSKLSPIDEALADYVGLHNLVEVKRDRSGRGHKGVEGVTQDGIKVKYRPHSVSLNESPMLDRVPGGLKMVLPCDAESARKFLLKETKRKGINLNVDEYVDKRERDGFFKPHLKTNTIFLQKDKEFKLNPVFRGAAKIALNFYLHLGFERKWVEEMISFVCKGSFIGPVSGFYYPLSFQVYEPANGEMPHVIHLVGNPKSKLLYCYVELFSVLCFLVVLNRDYCGVSMRETFTVDPYSGKPATNQKVNLNLLFDPLEMYKHQFNIWADIQRGVYKRYLKASKIILEKQTKALEGWVKP